MHFGRLIADMDDSGLSRLPKPYTFETKADLSRTVWLNDGLTLPSETVQGKVVSK